MELVKCAQADSLQAARPKLEPMTSVRRTTDSACACHRPLSCQLCAVVVSARSRNLR